MKIQRILCAVEMRLDDINVLACACALARPFGARVDTLLVRDGHGPPTTTNSAAERSREPDSGREAELLFAELLASTPGGRAPAATLGGPRAILERSEACASDLIVLGLPRPSALHGATLTDALSRRAACPILTVPLAARTFGISRILLPVDFSPATKRAVEWAGTLAQRFSATVHVLHAVGSSALREGPTRRGEPIRTTLARARGRLEEIEHDLRARTVWCESSLVERGTTHAILAGRERLESDLIVMGMHGGGGERVEASGMVATIRARSPVPLLSMSTPEVEACFVLGDPMRSRANPFYERALCADGRP